MKRRLPDPKEDLEVVENDCQEHKFNRKDAMDHSRWRKLIKDD